METRKSFRKYFIIHKGEDEWTKNRPHKDTSNIKHTHKRQLKNIKKKERDKGTSYLWMGNIV